MEYVLKCYFTGSPECQKCMLRSSIGLNLEGETVLGCYGLGTRPKCPDGGCRKDCPLQLNDMEKAGH